MVLAMMEMVKNGLFTKKVHYPFMQVDAIYLKVRENGHVESRGLLVAVGIYEEGYREIIGFRGIKVYENIFFSGISRPLNTDDLTISPISSFVSFSISLSSVKVY